MSSASEEADVGDVSTGKCNVLQAAMLIVAAVVGLGIMALPASISTLGWLPGMGALLAMFSLNLYTGLLLWRLRVALPGALSYTHLGAELMGSAGESACRAITLLQLVMLNADYLLVNTLSLAAVAPGVTLCRPTWGVLMAAVLLPLAQLRRLEHVSYLSLGSAAAVGGVVLLCLRQMAADVAAQNPALPVATQWATHADALEGFHALSTMIFACGSQFVYLEVMAEMHSVKRFPWAMGLAAAFILSSYVTIAAAGYRAYGSAVSDYIVDIVSPAGHARRAASLLMLLHTVVSYVLMSQVLCTSLLRLLHSAPRRLKKAEDLTGAEPRAGAREEWLGVSAGVLALAYLIANVVPFFEELTALIGAAIGAPISFGLPAAFALRARAQGKMRVSPVEAVFLHALVVFAAAVVAGGLASSARALRYKWGTLGYPFECQCMGPACPA